MKITEINREELSSAMQQYYDFKINHLDKIVMFQLGDFYEMFFQDAIDMSNKLSLTLTSKAAGLDEKIPMAGIPQSTLEQYVAKIIELELSVVIVVQDETQSVSKIVNRKIKRIITPGTFYKNDDFENQYSASVYYNNNYYLSYGDLNTGQMFNTVFSDLNNLLNEIINLNIREIIDIGDCLVEVIDEIEYHNITLTKYNYIVDYNISNIQNTDECLLKYFNYITQDNTYHLSDFKTVNNATYLQMSNQTQKQLELFKTSHEMITTGSLYWFLNDTQTAMGKRLLKDYLIHPLVDKNIIEERLNYISVLVDNVIELSTINNDLKNISDFERIIFKISDSSINPREALSLKDSIKVIPNIYEKVNALDLKFNTLNCEKIKELSELIEITLFSELPATFKDGNIINEGFNKELDRLRVLKNNSSKWLLDFEKEQKELTSIKNLKIKFNKIFGYFIEVTNSSLDLVPDSYIRKQTMSNCERYITKELKEQEEDILNATHKIVKLEQNLYNELKEKLKLYIIDLVNCSNFIAKTDVSCSFAKISLKYNLCKPTFSNDDILIKDGFHPIVKTMNKDFVNNDFEFVENDIVLLITGPNMAGKSTYMRQVVITNIMAQIGCFVCASFAKLKIYDKIFTRIGAGDDLAGGKSTFMVEMSETAYALNNATSNSFLIFDELGRGTSTADGVCLAQSIIEYVTLNIKCNTLFSTHYHELTQISNNNIHLKNVHVNAIKENNNLVFLHKVKPGYIEKSYGVDVANLAKLPISVVRRAKKLIDDYELKDPKQMSLFELNTVDLEYENNVLKSKIEEISNIDTNNLTPIEALNLLVKIKKNLEE